MGIARVLSTAHARLVALTGSFGGGTEAGSFLALTHRGAKSGISRRTPLTFINHHGGYVIAGSNIGSTVDPAWAHDIRAHPEASVNVEREEIPVTARPASGEERAVLWQRFEDLHPRWETYQRKAGDRIIPLFVLSPR